MHSSSHGKPEMTLIYKEQALKMTKFCCFKDPCHRAHRTLDRANVTDYDGIALLQDSPKPTINYAVAAVEGFEPGDSRPEMRVELIERFHFPKTTIGRLRTWQKTFKSRLHGLLRLSCCTSSSALPFAELDNYIKSAIIWCQHTSC